MEREDLLKTEDVSAILMDTQLTLKALDRVGRFPNLKTIDYLEQARLPLHVTVPVPAWRRYQQHVNEITERPRIAVVIDDVGLSRSLAESFIGLDPAITLSLLPYSRHVTELATKAYEMGHEVLVHMPMQPDNDKDHDPGPNALLLGLGEKEILRRMRSALDRVPFKVGINNHMGSQFTASQESMNLVLKELYIRGLMFLDSRTTSKSVAYAMAKKMNVATAERDIFLDNEQQENRILSQLAKAERVARKYGHAVVLGHPYPTTLRVLRSWIAKVEASGISLVPITSVAAIDSSRPWIAQTAIPKYSVVERQRSITPNLLFRGQGNLRPVWFSMASADQASSSWEHQQ